MRNIWLVAIVRPTLCQILRCTGYLFQNAFAKLQIHLTISALLYQSFFFSTHWLFLALLPEIPFTRREALTPTVQYIFRSSQSGEVRSLRTVL
jgi:hypothetical protein